MTIKQRYESDCFLCCAAMAVGIDYDEALAIWGHPLALRIARDGVKTSGDTTRVLDDIGLKEGQHYVVRDVRKDGEMQPIPPALLARHRAIMQVVSLNHEDRFHMVFWDRQELHDPSRARVYSSQDLKVGWVWLLSSKVLSAGSCNGMSPDQGSLDETYGQNR